MCSYRLDYCDYIIIKHNSLNNNLFVIAVINKLLIFTLIAEIINLLDLSKLIH